MLLFLLDGGREGRVCLEKIVADAECLLGARREGLGKLDAEILDVTTGSQITEASTLQPPN